MMLHRCVHVHVDAETARVVAVARAPDTAIVTGVSKKFYVPELFPRVVGSEFHDAPASRT
jgi:hypothetical protein